MKFKITVDTKGITAWPDMSLTFATQDTESQFYDPKCEYRGDENLWEFVENILGEELKDGDVLKFEVTRILKENKK